MLRVCRTRFLYKNTAIYCTQLITFNHPHLTHTPHITVNHPHLTHTPHVTNDVVTTICFTSTWQKNTVRALHTLPAHRYSTLHDNNSTLIHMPQNTNDNPLPHTPQITTSSLGNTAHRINTLQHAKCYAYAEHALCTKT